MNPVVALPDPHRTIRKRGRKPTPSTPAYVELGAISNFSFLRGGSHPGEMVASAALLGHAGLGLCDINTLAGVVRGFSAHRDVKKRHPAFRYHVGARLVFADGTPDILAYPTDREAYGRLCLLLTTGNLRVEKGQCRLFIADLLTHAEGLQLIVMPPRDLEAGKDALRKALVQLQNAKVWLGADPLHDGSDRARINRLAAIALSHRVPLLATNNPLYHTPDRRRLQDVLTCIREHVTIDTAGLRLEKNAERHLKAPADMARLFADHPEAIAETLRFAEALTFELSELAHNYPEETVGNGETAQQTLVRLTWEGAHKRYPRGIPDMVTQGVERELALIAEKDYAPYFLTVHDLVRFARDEQKILCQGRGSAANSMVCYCLGVTEVEPVTGNLVFGRFLSTERDEPPDIDVDFEHERREEVIQYLYKKYSRARTGLTATVVTYRSRGALREVGKVFGLSEDAINAMNGLSWGSEEGKFKEERLRQLGLDPHEPRLKLTLDLAQEIMGFPRHLSQHSGGFVITRDRLDHMIPIAKAAMEDRTMVEWNKDDLDALDILKVDVLALGMLTCIRRAFEMMHRHYGQDLTLDEINTNRHDDRVYAMMQRADTLGVFQIESRAQMSMLPRLKPEKFYDLVIEVAIVRPGPIQGGMVHPYLKRRMAREEVTYPSQQLKAVLERTLGVPLFQEQAMQIAVVGAGFSSGEADKLRRAMATWRQNGTIKDFRQRFIKGMADNGYDPDFATRCFAQIEGFGEYGFPESHAASFALLVYVSSWLKCFYPDVFAAALLNSQPMGFYAPAQIIRDAREHGVEIRAADINLSFSEATLEAGSPARGRVSRQHASMAPYIEATHAVRLGLTQITGLPEAAIGKLLARRGEGYGSVRDLWQRTGLSIPHLEILAGADAFGSLGLSRRDALWTVRGLKGAEGAGNLPLFAASPAGTPLHEPDAPLPAMPAGEEIIHDYKALTLSLKGHPMAFLRAPLEAQRTVTCGAVRDDIPNGRVVALAGLVLVRQRPGTAKGVIFLTLEDETGQANVIVWEKVFDAYRRTVLGARVLRVTGTIQRESGVTHLVARHFEDLTAMLGRLSEPVDPAALPQVKDDTVCARREAHAAMPKGRNFH